MEIDTKKMNATLRRVGEIVLEEEKKSLERLGRELITEKLGESKLDTYYCMVSENLWAGIGDEDVKYPHLKRDYADGSGGELKDGKFPAKMKSIRSSSAMTYNLLGNDVIELVKQEDAFSKGRYHIEYEKKLLTLRKSPQPANIDAFLYNEQVNEAIFCEMKMLEWLGKPCSLKDAYMSDTLYYANNGQNTRAVECFLNAINLLKKAMCEYGDGNCFYRYDAWQMFKHTLGIYNMTSRVTRDEIVNVLKNRKGKGRTKGIEMLSEIRKATLVNVVFEPPSELFDEGLRREYERFLELEHTCFDVFREVMLQSGVVEVFYKDCGVEFGVMYRNTREFMQYFDLGERKLYLERYRLEKR